MGELYPNQYFGIDIWKHKDLPLIESHDFNFFRCIAFRDSYYGKTISELHTGNLRVSRKDNRYSQLFPGQRLSYWADSSQTARAEAKKWGAKNNLLTFWAYDDGIQGFLAGINEVDDVINEWHDYVATQKETQLATLIAEERLRDAETRQFMANAFRDGAVKTTGMDIDNLLPPMSRFGGGNRAEKKRIVTEKLVAFFNRFFGIG